jgi:DNA-binding NtrC family response regulator
MVRILFIDDDPNIHIVLRMCLPGECAVIPATDGAQGVRLAQEEDPDVILLDIGLPDIDGMQVLRRILALPAAPPVIMLTATGDTTKVVEAIKIGAHDYIVKPFTHEKVFAILRTAVHVHTGDRQIPDEVVLPRIIGHSPGIRHVKHLIALYATSESPVLILGETGTGKELVARSIHDLSERRREIYVPINCGAIPETLMETELFGSEKGAYTDAVARPGVFERAHRGTLFLDEIGEMTLLNQVKLLRVMEEKSFCRMGGVRTIASDARIIAATNRAVGSAVKTGSFREDLYYRINTLPLSIPPLRRRRVDIPPLVRAFLQTHAARGSAGTSISSSAIEKLIDHDWPGNIRELKNVTERAFLFAGRGQIKARHIFFE